MNARTTWATGVFVVLLAACSGSNGQPAPIPTEPPTATVPPRPTPTVAPPSPTPLPPTPTITPVPPTATPVPALPMQISAQLDPPTPHAGDEFVVALSVTNNGDHAARGIYIATSGPWDTWTVLGVEPNEMFYRDAAGNGWHIISNEEVPAGETRTVLVHVRADEPSQEQLTFAVREAEPSELSQ